MIVRKHGWVQSGVWHSYCRVERSPILLEEWVVFAKNEFFRQSNIECEAAKTRSGRRIVLSRDGEKTIYRNEDTMLVAFAMKGITT